MSRSSVVVHLLCVFAVMVVVSSKTKVKPASTYFHICRRSNPKELNECIKKSMMMAKVQLKDGIPALGLVPLEPLVIPRMELVQGSGSFALKTTLTDFVIKGLSQYTVTDVNFLQNDTNLTFDVTMRTPEMKMTADYKMDGQILVIPIRGNGNCEMNFTDVVTVSHTLGRVVEREGEKYIQIVDIKWDVSIDHTKSKSWFYNLFNGDKQLGDATNNFLNANGKDAFQAIKHLPEEAFGEVFKDLSSRVYDVYPIKELLLD